MKIALFVYMLNEISGSKERQGNCQGVYEKKFGYLKVANRGAELSD